MNHPDIAGDTSALVNYDLRIGLRNGQLTPEQREAFHTALVNAARMLRMQLMFAVPDERFAQVKLERQSSSRGKHTVPFFEEE